ncbi:MAG TPA: hypothetical protein VD995_16945 [Azospirillum sp.]|nr:hypothetical protein [Azospirillum sp.]
MNRFRTALLALAAVALLPAAAEAGRITFTNSSGTVARIKWKVADSESGWTTLALGQSVFRDFPDDYPPIEVYAQYQAVVLWEDACWWRTAASDNANLKLTGTLYNLRCKRD